MRTIRLKSPLCVVLTFFLVALVNTLASGRQVQSSQNNIWHQCLQEATTPAIDSLDTVIFDLSQAVYVANTVSFPVYFSSDDLVYAFDFALRFADSRLVYDTITLAPAGSGLLAYSFLNPADTVIRFTSSQFVALPNRQPIALIHFELANGTSALDTTDIYNLRGLLNGDPCSELVIPPGVTALEESAPALIKQVYPNPASSTFTLLVDEPCVLKMYVNGHLVSGEPIQLLPGENQMDVPAVCRSGNYILHVTSAKGSSMSSIILAK